jgi:hypothetical protein
LPDETGCASFESIAKNKGKSSTNTSQALGLSVGESLFDLMSDDSNLNYILNSFIKG